MRRYVSGLPLVVTVALAACAGGCDRPAEETAAPPAETIAWRPLGSWSGRGGAQTDSFTSESGSLRVQWKTENEAGPGTGTFRLTIHSAISGRPLAEAVYHRGEGRDTAYVREDPRVFFAVVEASNVDWSFTVEEAVMGRIP